MAFSLSLGFFLGIAITSALSSPSIKSEFANNKPLILSDQHHHSIPTVESIVDSRFKLLAADFQDQIDDLKVQVITLKASKTINLGMIPSQHQHDIQKRQANSSKLIRPVCENSSSFCTFFHPDHPDAGRKRGNYTPTIPQPLSEPTTTTTFSATLPTTTLSTTLPTTTLSTTLPTTTLSTTLPTTPQPPKVKGMPTSCSDLQLLGHKLNGLYLVKTSQPNKGTKIETIFCDFQSAVAVSQKSVGNVDVKTKIVHFYMQKKNPFASKGVVPFELNRLNEGEAMDLTTGIFTAPVPGIYHFEFSALKDKSTPTLSIYLQVNSGNVGQAFTSSYGANDNWETLSLTASLRLKAKDRVNLFNDEGTVRENDRQLTHFTGWLVEEDLV